MKEINKTFSNAYTLIESKINGWLEQIIEMLPNFLVALVVMLFFAFLARLLKKGLKRALYSASVTKSINTLLVNTIYVVVLIVGIFISLSILNLQKTVTSLLAGAGIVGLALGFAFQDIAANFMSGVVLAVRKPIKAGDLIESNGFFGTVNRVNLRATEIHTPQGQVVIIPNRRIFDSAITNYTSTHKRRVDLTCGVSYGDDLEKVKKVTLDAIKSLDIVDHDKGVTLFFKEFGDHSINYELRYWVRDSTVQSDYLDAMSQGIIAIKKAYDDNDIMIPFPIRTLDFGIKGGEKLSDMPVSLRQSKKKGKKGKS